MTELDLRFLQGAKALLEKPRVGARVANLIGTPIEKGIAALPSQVRSTIEAATQKSIQAALNIALNTITDKEQQQKSKNLYHKLLVAGTGGLGGFLGASTLLLELPISTTIMMRSILDIARSEGEDLNDPEVKLACLQVFAFGGKSKGDDAVDAGYFATRAALARAVSQAATVLVDRGAAKEGAPILARLVLSIATRFQVVVSEKLAAQVVPLLGALGGSGINVLFMDHFQDMARGHFVIRRLERKYGVEEVQRRYQEIKI
ncbi:EcsC family protein [Bdellovibrio sp. HCB2-146]|uniref:EcsC family protein n=1 Tax=Bdellovibrio sp. HCB2-146 TaxID=3394362 RepID=UPI0039BC2252